MKFPRCIRLDASDLNIYTHAAEPGEWAVPGGFAYADCDPESLERKARLAFHGAWLGTGSFGHSTLAEVAELDDNAFAQVVERLAQHFVDNYGAPDLEAARPVARAEVEEAAALCEHKIHTLLALEREMTEAGVVERYRVIEPGRAQEHAKIWEIVPEDDADNGTGGA
jgi:hypothetical protein